MFVRLHGFFYLFCLWALSSRQDSWEGVALKAGTTFLLMGTPGELRVEPAEKIKFAEDMAASEIAAAVCFMFLFFFAMDG